MTRACLLLLLPVMSLGQAPDPTPEALEKTEKAHQRLQKPEVKKSETASKITEQVADMRPGSSGRSAQIPRRNYIDEHILGRMERDGIPHAGLTSDLEFVRRAYLDATGRIPPVADVLAFVDDPDPDKRDQLIERLLESDEFVERWSFYFEDLFRAGQRMGFGKNLFHYWIQEWLRLDRPYSDVATELLTGSGKTSFSVPGGLYYARDFVKAKDDPEEPDALDLVNFPDTIDEFTITYMKVFLGMNLGCISCHDGRDHLEQVNLFFTGKTREEFYQQASFFGRTRLVMNWENGFQANTEYTVDDIQKGYDSQALSIVRIPRFGGSNEPRFILTGEAARPDADPRDELARMLTGNIQFGRAFVNRIWAEFMGFGIVEPVDDFDLARYYPTDKLPEPFTAQASHPELLDTLAKDFQNHDYSFKHVVRTIMRSGAYQMSSRFDGEWKEEYARYFARKYVRMLSAPELHDAIALATSKPGAFKSGSEQVGLVTQMADPWAVQREVAEFLRAFGQASRDEMPRKLPTSSLQAMLLMNSKLVLEKVLAEGNSRVEQLLKGRAVDRVVVEEAYRAALSRAPSDEELAATLDRSLVDRIYLATLSRRPREAEMSIALQAMAHDRSQGAQNLQWALINSPEFIFNY